MTPRYSRRPGKVVDPTKKSGSRPRTRVPKTPPPAAPTGRRFGCGWLLFAVIAVVLLGLALAGRNR